MSNEVTFEAMEPELLGGSGGPNSRDRESGLTAREDAQLTALAVRRGWIGTRCPTRMTEAEILAGRKPKALPMLDGAALSVSRALRSRDYRASLIAARTVVAMESQNQADDHHDGNSPVPAVNVNVGVVSDGPVQIYIPDNGRDPK